MSLTFEEKIKLLTTGENSRFISKGLKGLEKESLRVTQSGSISKLPHPSKWGSALTNPHITTDYSEALPEFITPPFEDTDKTLNFLKDIHNIIFKNIFFNELPGIERIELYKKVWPLDKDIQINKLDTHLTNLKHHLFRDLDCDFKFITNAGKVMLITD